MSLSLGKILIEFGADVSALKAGVGTVEKEVSGVTGKVIPFSNALDRVGISSNTAGKALNFLGVNSGAATVALAGTAVAVGAVAIAAGAGIAHVINMGDKLIALRDKTGLTTTFLQQLQHVTGQLGVPFDSTASAISKLQVNIGKAGTETQETLTKMGVSFTELRGMNAEQQFTTIATAIGSLKSPTDQAAAAVQIFGRAGVELLPLLRGDFAGLAQEATDLGLVMSEKVLTAGDQLGDNWTTLKNVGMAFLGEAVGPLVAKLAEYSTAALNATKIDKDAAAESARKLAIGQELNIIMQTGIPHTQALAMATERVAQKERDMADALAASAAELRAYGVAQESVAAKEAEAALAAGPSAAVRVAQAIATKDLATKHAELASFVGMTTEKFLEMDAGFIAATGIAMQAEKTKGLTAEIVTHNSALQGTFSALSAIPPGINAAVLSEGEYIATLQASSAEQLAISEANAAAWNASRRKQEADHAAMTASFQRWGTFTRTTSQVTADKLRADFDQLLATGGATAAQLQAAWEKAEEAKRKASTDTGTSVTETWLNTTASIAGSLASLGGKWRKFALAEGAAAGALAILKAWSSAPWPANLPAVAATTVAVAVNIANIARQSFAQGTPGLDFANFGREQPAMLHGREAVIPRGGGHVLANEIAASLGQAMFAPTAVSTVSDTGGERTSDGGAIQNVIMLDGKVLAEWYESASKRGAVRTHTAAVKEF